jgi:hypothetical protein
LGLIIISGDVGSGKTLLETEFALTSKLPVLANYDIGDFSINPDGTKKLIKRHPNIQLLDIGNLFHLPYPKCRVLLDEAYAYLESRVSMSKLNQYMSYILFQSRKRGIDFILTAQLTNSIDNRFNNLCDLNIVAQQIKGGFRYFVTNGVTIKILFMPYKKAEKIWNKYDTAQVIMPPQMEDLETQVQILDRKTLKKKVDELEKDFKLQYGDVKVTHALVDGFLLDNDESDVYGSYLYARLQKPS